MNNQELIPTQKNGDNIAVNARDLHGFLEVKTDFTKWSKRMFEYGFEQNKDYAEVYVKNDVNPINIGGRPNIDYVLTIDCAKEIAMLQRSEKGKQARLYFIECEKRAKSSEVMNPLDYMQMQLNIMKQQNVRIDGIETRVNLIEAKTTTRPNYFTVVGYCIYAGIGKISYEQAKKAGIKAAAICRKKGYKVDKIPDPRFGMVGSYPVEVLDEVFKEPF